MRIMILQRRSQKFASSSGFGCAMSYTRHQKDRVNDVGGGRGHLSCPTPPSHTHALSQSHTDCNGLESKKSVHEGPGIRRLVCLKFSENLQNYYADFCLIPIDYTCFSE